MALKRRKPPCHGLHGPCRNLFLRSGKLGFGSLFVAETLLQFHDVHAAEWDTDLLRGWRGADCPEPRDSQSQHLDPALARGRVRHGLPGACSGAHLMRGSGKKVFRRIERACA